MKKYIFLLMFLFIPAVILTKGEHPDLKDAKKLIGKRYFNAVNEQILVKEVLSADCPPDLCLNFIFWNRNRQGLDQKKYLSLKEFENEWIRQAESKKKSKKKNFLTNILIGAVILGSAYVIITADERHCKKKGIRDDRVQIRNTWGAPEEVSTYRSENYTVETWSYWRKGAIFTFEARYDSKCNRWEWILTSEYYFTPIQKEKIDQSEKDLILRGR